jgi:hypothetical protein
MPDQRGAKILITDDDPIGKGPWAVVGRSADFNIRLMLIDFRRVFGARICGRQLRAKDVADGSSIRYVHFYALVEIYRQLLVAPISISPSA